MGSRLVTTKSFTIELPTVIAESVADVPDLSTYVWRLISRREIKIDAAIRTLVTAGWRASEILGGALAWATYFSGPPTEVPREHPTARALKWGTENADVLHQFGLVPEEWANRIDSVAVSPDTSDAVAEVGRALLDGAGIATLRRRLEQLVRP